MQFLQKFSWCLFRRKGAGVLLAALCPAPSSTNPGMALVHNKRGNVLMCDGHVKSMGQGDLATINNKEWEGTFKGVSPWINVPYYIF